MIAKNKKATKGEIEHKIKSAVVFVPKDRDTKSIYFDDKGLRITVTDDYAVIATGAHQHVFRNITAIGESRPYMYTQQFVNIALANDCTVRDEKGVVSRSYAKLFALLKEKEDKTEYNLSWFIDLWLNNIFAPLFQIDESAAGAFIVYEQYLHTIAKSQAILSEKTSDVTNVQFANQILETEKSYLEGLQENVIFKKKTDEERLNAEIDALTKNIVDETVNKDVADGQ